MVKLCARNVIWSMTGSPFGHVFESRPDVCYKKYLGPDWVADYDGDRCATVVGNHSCFVDHAVIMSNQFPSFVSKATTRDIPFIGKIADVFKTLFLDRSSVDDRKKLVQ